MKTITIQIGNSDDKLTQKEWAGFNLLVNSRIKGYAQAIHFHGVSTGDADWQNAAWIIELDDFSLSHLKRELKRLRQEYKQDSVAWTIGKTEFI